jgi:hypothetical protein
LIFLRCCCSGKNVIFTGRRLLFAYINKGVNVIDWIFLSVTGVIAYHALTHRNEDGENDTGHQLFGAIALLFFSRVLFVDILKLF